ncbi:MAG: TIGR04084 family radical SAM/SPASM domain-containing protein [Nitrososphaeria archaeon]
MLYILHTTGQCNLNCKYCGGSLPKEKVPWEIKYDLNLLKEIVRKDGDVDICFYGGEPLINSKAIMEVIAKVPAKRFIIQTNGLLMKQFSPKFWANFRTILLSIDGVREVTDYYRGEGVYDKVLEAAKTLKAHGYRGDLVARMALAERGDVFRDVSHLLSLNLFNHVHWQLNVMWCSEWSDFEGWAQTNYLPGCRKLVDLWVNRMKDGKVLGIAPFQGIFGRILCGGETPPCGAGKSMFAISTDGRVLACPIAFEERWAEICNISGLKVREPKAISIGEPCIRCEVFKECGGRCLYAYMERFWGEEGFTKVCELNKKMIQMIKDKREQILDLIDCGKISKNELLYPEFNNSIEIIP